MGKKLTQEEFDVRIQNMTGNSYVFLEPFDGVNLKHDCMKKAYAEYHGFNLLAISFYCDNFSSIKNKIVRYIRNAGYSFE